MTKYNRYYMRKLKQKRKRIRKLKELGQFILIVIGFIVAMAIGGITYPY